MFAPDLENIAAPIETLTTAFKEIDEEKKRTIHPMLLSLGEFVPSSPARLTFAQVILWILAVSIEEKTKRGQEKNESTTGNEVDDPFNA